MSAFWLRTECFDDITVYMVEVLVSEHKKVEVKETKDTEIENLKRQMSQLLGTVVGTRMFTDSRSLLESIGSSRQIKEKSLRMSVASFKKNLEGERWMILAGLPEMRLWWTSSRSKDPRE